MAPDPAVTACLETRWHVLGLSPPLVAEGCVLPLMDVLGMPAASHVRVVRVVPSPALRHARNDVGSGDVDARCVAEMMRRNGSVEELDVSYVGLGAEGVHEVASFVAVHPNLRRLVMAHNTGGREAYDELAEAIRVSPKLEFLDVSFNMLGHTTIRKLQRARPSLHIEQNGNRVVEEVVNAGTHFLSLLAAVCAVGVLLFHAVRLPSWAVFFSCVAYSFTLLCMFGFSTACHSTSFLFRTASKVTNALDHAAIYLLIAGSCAPFLHVGLAHNREAYVVAAVQWVLALTGITFNLYATVATPGWWLPKYKMGIELVIYFSEGLVVLFLLDDLKEIAEPRVVELLTLCGALYSFGSIFFMAEHHVHPLFHGVWHLFVTAAAFVHWTAVFEFVGAMERAVVASSSTAATGICGVHPGGGAHANGMNATSTAMHSSRP